MSGPGILPILVLFILISAKSEDVGNNNHGDGSTVPACNNCTICQYPCHPPGDQSYAAPPPPPPPPPPLAPLGQVNCPPAAPVICCGGGQYYAPPTPFYYPYNNYSGAAANLQLLTSFVSTWPLAVSLLLICY